MLLLSDFFKVIIILSGSIFSADNRSFVALTKLSAVKIGITLHYRSGKFEETEKPL